MQGINLSFCIFSIVLQFTTLDQPGDEVKVEKGDDTHLESGLLKIKSFASFLLHFSPLCTWKATCESCLTLQIKVLQGNKQVAAGKVSTQSDKFDV